MKNFILFLSLISLPCLLNAQYLTGIGARFNDSFSEWNFYTELVEEEGELSVRWEDNWGEWDYRLEEIFGTIKLKWRDRPDEWELRGGNQIVTARTLWKGDLTEWRVSDNTITLTLRSKWKNQPDEWEVRNSSHGKFLMYTNYEGDPRDWTIIDELDEEVSTEMRIMLMFIVAFHSSPNR